MSAAVAVIAAVVIGGTLLSGGRGTIVGTVLGVLILNTLTNVFTLNNLSSSAQAVARDPADTRDHHQGGRTGMTTPTTCRFIP